jgi:HEAT repeat protein
MLNSLNSLLGTNLPAWFFFLLPVVLAGFVILVFWFVRTRIFKFLLRRIVKAQDAKQAEEAVRKFSSYYPAEKLMRYSRRMERYSRQMGPQIVRETGLADKWTEKLLNASLVRAVDLRRVLLYCPSSSVFTAFLAAGQHPRLRKVFIEWMKKEGEEKVIRLLAETCRGENFDPEFGKIFMENSSALLRELTGEPEWYTRYFAYQILQFDREVVTERTLEAGLSDPHPLIRKIMTTSYKAEREKTWIMLWDKLLHDPVFEVREAARKHIAQSYMHHYNLKDKELTDVETTRILEQLDPECQEDRTFAMTILEKNNLSQGGNREHCYLAAVFLDKCGILHSLLSRNTIYNQKGIEDSITLLHRALEVNVSGFLKDYPSGDGAPLLVVARLLSSICSLQENLCHLERKVFYFFGGRKPEPSIIEIYTKTLDAVAAHGSMRAYEILTDELLHRENDPVYLNFLLPMLPRKAERLFSHTLFHFLERMDFGAREELIRTLGSFSPDIILPEVFRILNAARPEYPHIVRISALKIIARLHLPFCLQRILESLPTLTMEETEEFARLIADYPKEMFEEKVKLLLASPDAGIRAYLISILPVTKNESFLKEIRAALKDVDPDVRVAAIKALLGFGEIRLLNQETSMLHDPVERVRLATAEVIARHGNETAVEILKNTINDPNETDVVKIGVIQGLGQAVNAEGISILVDILGSANDFTKQAEKALGMRTSKRDIIRLIEIFKDAEPILREKLIPVFKAQGKEAEPRILEILKDEVASIKPYLVKILEETGYIDETKRKLSNRSVEVRREAAMMLSLLDTLSSFRGLVMAAKDPDQEVRVCVVKALEKLKTFHGREILEKLKEDPDNRIRKYTNWALERIDSLGME